MEKKMTKALIALDWGTTSFRAYLFDRTGNIMDMKNEKTGILQIQAKTFEETLIRIINPWLKDGAQTPIITSGMITSKQGWVETGYIPCPAQLSQLANGLVKHRMKSGHTIFFVPGVSFTSENGIPDVIRGEETQILGASDEQNTRRLFIMPGTHSKWLTAKGKRIEWFATFLTGEIYSALKNHTILGKLSVQGSFDKGSFMRGVEYALDHAADGGLLHKVFSARSLVLFGKLDSQGVDSYLSGLLIGMEIADGRACITSAKTDSEATLVGDSHLSDLYTMGLEHAGFRLKTAPDNCAAIGLLRVASEAGLFN